MLDTGIGIKEADQSRIFERFYRVDPARARATGGSGLGLSIVKHSVKQLGGRIELSSKPGEGSLFTVVLPRGGDEVSPEGSDRPVPDRESRPSPDYSS